MGLKYERNLEDFHTSQLFHLRNSQILKRLGVIDIVRSYGGRGVYLMGARGEGVLALCAHAFWPLKTFHWDCFGERSFGIQTDHYRNSFNFVNFDKKVYQKILSCWFYLAIKIYPLVVHDRQGHFSLYDKIRFFFGGGS